MKALSIHPYYAMSILYEEKTIECRSWSTDYRGPLLICSTREKIEGCIPSHALCVVTLANVRPFRKKDVKAADMDGMPEGRFYAWELEHVRDITPFPIRGKLGLFDVDDSLIEFLPEEFTDEEAEAWFKETLLPLIYKPARL